MKKTIQKISALIIAGTMGIYQINAQTHAINNSTKVAAKAIHHAFPNNYAGLTNYADTPIGIGIYGTNKNTKEHDNVFIGSHNTTGMKNVFMGYPPAPPGYTANLFIGNRTAYANKTKVPNKTVAFLTTLLLSLF